jgi:tetratricopeptide (TPR) repeat protein
MELMSLPKAKQLAFVRQASLGEDSCRALLDRAWGARTCPEESLWVARLAMLLADRLACPALRVRSRSLIGNAYRLLSRWGQAELWLGKALELNPEGDARAEALEMYASLRRVQGRTEDAARLLAEAFQLRRVGRDLVKVVDVLVLLGVVYMDLDLDKSLDYLTLASDIAPAGDANTQALIHHNAAQCLLQMGEIHEAWQTVRSLQCVYAAAPSIGEHPGRWHLEAKLRRALGISGEAEFRAAIAGYATAGVLHMQAVATLELAALLSADGRMAEATALVTSDMIQSVCGALDVAGVDAAVLALLRRPLAA